MELVTTSGADLSGADLRMANLSWTDIRAEQRDMTEPPLEAARIGANLNGAVRREVA